MLISDSHKFIFVHIRKAAGSSIRDILTPISNPIPKDVVSKIKSKILKIETNYQKFTFGGHSPILQGKNIIPKELYEDYFKFAIVRNPYTRLVSEYEYIKGLQDHGRHKKVTKMSFHQYISYQSKRFDAHQINMLTDKNGTLQMDFIGKLENINEDWNYISNKLKIPNAELSHRNKTFKVNYNDYYNDENRDLVSKLWKKDLEVFGYNYEDQ